MRSRPPLGAGWDRFRGWVDQYDRMLRWNDRLVGANAATTFDEGWAYDFWDVAFAFFQNAYHLKDWILVDHPELRPNLDTLVSKSSALAYCADICNGTKHREVSRNFRQPGHLAAIREWAPWEATGQRLSVIGPDGPQPVVELAGQCVDTWREFIRVHLPPNQTSV